MTYFQLGFGAAEDRGCLANYAVPVPFIGSVFAHQKLPAMRPTPITPKPGQESVWDYPRPPRLERVSKHVRILHEGAILADTNGAYRVLETSHPPVYYLPQADIQMQYLRERRTNPSFCEWKGNAIYWDLEKPGVRLPMIAWSYPAPTGGFGPIKDYLAFYAAPFTCYVGDEQATPQPGKFYGGWITADIVGPFKGEPGSWGW